MAPPSFEVKTGHLDDIQELRTSKPELVPERYIRETDERPSLSFLLDPSATTQVPVIDMSKLTENQLESTNGELVNLAKACKDWGFFQVINHGIDVEVLRSLEKVVMEFFALPLEEKEKYPMAPGTIQGYGHAFVFSEDQKLDWCNMFALGVVPDSIRKPKLWPTKPAAFSETLEVYSANIRRLAQKLLTLIAQTLGLKPTIFNDMFGDAVQASRMNYYPPCSRPDLVLGLSPHSDGSAITVLQQDTKSIGLQILKDGDWVPVKPIPDALVINIGDTLEVLTNGMYKSVEHRAVTDREIDRLSVATFYAPSYELVLGPLPEMINSDNPCKYRSYNHGEYSAHYVTSKLQGKKTLDFAKIEELIV